MRAWLWRRLPRNPLKRWLVLAGGAYLACLLALNSAVAFFGQTIVFPFSPFHVRGKLHALGQYFQHRPICVLTGGHDDLRPLVNAIALRHGLDRWLLSALVEAESGMQPHRISPTGAMGPAQLIGSTARMLGVDDPFDPQEGIDGGARYLKDMMRQFGGNEALAVAAYNAGPGAIVGRRVPRNGETEYYVDRIMARWLATRPPPPPLPPKAAQRPPIAPAKARVKAKPRPKPPRESRK